MKKYIKYVYEKKMDELTFGGEIKKVLERVFGLSRKEISRLKWQGEIRKNGKKAYVTEKLKDQDVLEIAFFEKEGMQVDSKTSSLSVIYEDEDFLIVNKPAGIPTHPSKNHIQDSLGSSVQAYFNEKQQHFVIRAIGRLDKNVSGAVLFAKNQPSAKRLSQQQQTHAFQKTYIAICEGKFGAKEGSVIQPIKKITNQKKRVISDDGDYAKTNYWVIKEIEYENKIFSVLKVQLETGRTHQIRLHMAFLKHPILGDQLYGSSIKWEDKIALHCYCMELYQPFSNDFIKKIASLPSYMRNLIDFEIDV